MSRFTVAITQPYVPAYRVPLFEELQRQLSELGGTMTVWSGTPTGTQQKRGDERSEEWMRDLPGRSFTLAGRAVRWRSLPRGLTDADVLITEFAALNFVAWRRIRHQPTLLWGHGRSYVTERNAFSEWLKWRLARRAAHVMTYTESGRDYVMQAAGLSSTSISAIGNSTDTTQLRSYLSAIDESATQAIRERYALGTGPVALFVGGLDTDKRVDFIVEAFYAAVRLDPSFRLIIAGRGELEGSVRSAAQADPRLVYLPGADMPLLAQLGAVADCIWMPGRVGLVAVDALALGLCVHSTHFKFHAPEIELLGTRDLALLDNEPARFAEQSLTRLQQHDSWPKRPLATNVPSVEAVARNIIKVIEKSCLK